MQARSADLPDFDDPPVIEVALAVQFPSLENFRTVHAGPLWETFRAEFPKFQEQPPRPPAFETFGVQPAPRIELEVLPGLPVPRLWFLNDDETQLIQFQPDRFVHNWRKTGEGDQYPRYESIKEKFIAELDRLSGFLETQSLGEIVPNQCEVTYVNHIRSVDGEDLRSTLATVFGVWTDPEENNDLPPFEDARFSARFVISLEEEKRIGRLTVTAEPARDRDGTPLVVFTLTARGQPAQPTIDEASHFLDLGRETIVKGFAALTTPEMHRRWRRKQ